jgi:hypothetical protein
MSLKYDYFDGSTGLLMQQDAAFAAGQAFVTTNQTQISSDLKTNAAAGFTIFTLNYPATMSSAILRGANGGGRQTVPNNLILKAYLAGITDGFATQMIYSYEMVPQLNITSNVDTTIDLNFSFQAQ